jgi:tetraacyldisaccharide 4'-kinase
VAAARTAVEEFGSQLVLLDDAFQHRRIHRDLDMVLVDALEPYGYGHLLPRGLLREPLAGLARADVIVFTRVDLSNEEERRRIRSAVGGYAPRAVFVGTAHRPRSLLAWPDQYEELDTLAEQPIAAFCGIGNPDGFRRTLEQRSYHVVGFRCFPDHHPYGREDIEQLIRWIKHLGVTTAVCTHKDLVKIQVDRLGDCPLRAVVGGIDLLSGIPELEARLRSLITREPGGDSRRSARA